MSSNPVGSSPDLASLLSRVRDLSARTREIRSLARSPEGVTPAGRSAGAGPASTGFAEFVVLKRSELQQLRPGAEPAQPAGSAPRPEPSGEPGRASDEAAAPAPTDAKIYDQDDLDAIDAAWQSKRGEAGYNARADANDDGVVDFKDKTHVLRHWGLQTPERAWEEPLERLPEVFGQEHIDAIQKAMGATNGDSRFSNALDVNQDGKLSFADITAVLANWGKPIPPTG